MVHISKLLLRFLHRSLSVCLPQTAQDILKDAAGFSYSHCRVETQCFKECQSMTQWPGVSSWRGSLKMHHLNSFSHPRRSRWFCYSWSEPQTWQSNSPSTGLSGYHSGKRNPQLSRALGPQDLVEFFPDRGVSVRQMQLSRSLAASVEPRLIHHSPHRCSFLRTWEELVQTL